MRQENKKTTVRIIAAFMLLCAVSAFRQFGMRFSPQFGMVFYLNDPVRAVIVFAAHLALLAGWWAAISHRITQPNMRVFLMAENYIMLFWITVRFLQAAILYNDTYLSRISGYLVAIPTVFLPLFGLFASFGLGKTEDFRFNRNWFYFLIPAGILATLMLTNESHSIVFRSLENEVHPNLYYHPNIGIYVLLAWAFFLLFARIILIYRRSRSAEVSRFLRSVPVLVAVFMLLLNVPYLFSSFVVSYEIIEHTLFLFFLETVVWESCIIAGMVPVNTNYEEVFDRSTVAMQIVNTDGHVFLKSAGAPELSTEIFDQLKKHETTRTPEGQELHIRAIRGGYSIWQNDVSQTIAVIDKLRKTSERMEQEGELLRQELKVRSDETAVKEQNRIYNQLTDEIDSQLLLLSDMLGKREWVKDKAALFREICLIGTYIKRRCNLRLVEQSDGIVANSDLELCFQEMIACLRQMGVEAEIIWNSTITLAPEFAIFALDMFEFLLEYEHFELHSVKVILETDAIFSVQARSERGLSGQIPVDELQRINRNIYDMRWKILEDVYQVSVCDGRG